ncbi:MAG TPA: class I SAM-dependent methyltransferase, partial [Acidimicrobiales bacterium]|nr:class I SAM-dependent methyltransferase [Acidimicrobiales bacterium]
HPNVAVVRADLRRAPFAPESFDFVCSLGVLHHLDDPEAGFQRLVRLLAPGGRVLVYLYSRPERLGTRRVGLAAASGARRLTVRLPHPVMRALSAPVAGALYVTFVLPGAAGRRFGVTPLARLPLATYRGQPVRSLWLDTFDRLSAPVEHRYVWSELEPWFRDAGLEVEGVREEAGLFIVARRPGR